jgi:hypothetical protein
MRSPRPNYAGLVAVVVAVLAGGVVATGASGVPHSEPAWLGRLTGALYMNGGPPAPPGDRSVDTYKQGGPVSVFQKGHLVARHRVGAGHDFNFSLRVGTYKAVAGKSLHNSACPARFVRIRRGVATHIKLYCNVA